MDIRDKIISAESSGNPDKANKPNKTSSALGLGQFINGTWLDMIKRYRGDLAKGKSDAEILELRKNAELSKEMTAHYAAENEARLRQAGVPVTPASTYLMHFAGPGGGVKLLKADPDTPVESILDGNAIQANPFLRGKTASWVIAWANRKMENAAASRPNVAPPRAPWDGGAQPVPSLAQMQAVEPAFGATGWPPRSASSNMLSPDDARPFAGAPSTAPIPLADGAARAQQVLDNSLPTPGASPWDAANRFGRWSSLGGVSGPVSSSAGGGGAASFPPVRFPLEALLAPDSGRGLAEWASSSRRSAAPLSRQNATNNPDVTAPESAGGLLGLIQDYMRNNAS